MMRYVAFLRAVNVGGRTVKMDALRAHFADLGFEDVTTFLASGNVAFDASDEDRRAIEARIEAHLLGRLGYEVATFVRTPPELARIASYEPFGTAPAAATLHVGFLAGAPSRAARNRVLGLASDDDRLALRGRELYWLRNGPLMASPTSGAAIEKTLGGPMTMRNVSTVRKISAQVGSGLG